jgi:HKD family nuclease
MNHQVKLIDNHGKSNHDAQIAALIKGSDEVWIAVAFLKSSGLKNLLSALKSSLKNGAVIKVVAGKHFGLTEPNALYELHRLFEKHPSSKLYLAKAESANSIFHPKFFLFRKGDKCVVISGSANMTSGGLTSNTELSVQVDTTTQSDLWKDSKMVFNRLISIENADVASLMEIAKYESFYESQKKHHREAKAIPKTSKRQREFSYGNLKSHFERFDKAERETIYRDKMQDYREAKKVLDAVADDDQLTKKIFESHLFRLVGESGQKGLWHSGSMGRLKTSVVRDYREFSSLVRYIRSNKSKSPAFLFENAQKLIKAIDGAGVNYITEIMMTYNFESFANLNKNPLTVLIDVGGLHLKKTYAIYNGEDYALFCEIVTEIKKELGLRNMLEADSFFNDIYWKIHKK